MKAIGLMSGTSADGVDAALVEIQQTGEGFNWELLAFDFVPFPVPLQRDILNLCDVQTGRVDGICHMNALLGEWFADAALTVCKKARISPDLVDVIGSHGQTIHHLPEPVEWGGKRVRSTLQIGDPSVIAERTGITTVSDFRSRDMAAGGQGAPLVPLLDFLVFRSQHLSRVMLNIGGISNITVLPAGCGASDVFAFDTGPGNMVIDGLVNLFTHGQQAYDQNGRFAQSGHVRNDLLQDLMQHPYFERPIPKSTGREVFGQMMVHRLIETGHQEVDLICTATAWTAESIGDAIRRFVLPVCDVSEMIVSGGGAENPVIMARLKQILCPIVLKRTDELGLPSEAKEAVAFAMLASETIQGRPGNIPRVTGATHPVILGSITPGRRCRFAVDQNGNS